MKLEEYKVENLSKEQKQIITKGVIKYIACETLPLSTVKYPVLEHY